MSYQASVYDVMIASPGDVQRERDIARQVIYEWNNVHSRKNQIVLQPTGWETHSTPSMEGRAQEVINVQILKHCDLLIGIFWNRLGTPTGEALSGTVEEIEEHIKAGKPAMIYFSAAPAEVSKVDREQFDKLMEFKKSLMERGLIEEFRSADEFRAKLQRQLASKINEHAHFAKAETHVVAGKSSRTQKSGLGVEAMQLLVEASKDPGGIIQYVAVVGGRHIATNGKKWVLKVARERALWEKAVGDLHEGRLIARANSAGNVFKVTAEGFELADSLAAEEGSSENT